MKCTSIAVAMMFFLAIPVSVLAEEQTVSAEAPVVSTEVQPVSNTTAEKVESGSKVVTPANTATSHSMHEMGCMHKGKGQQGKGRDGMKHGGGQHGKGKHDKHEQVVKRLDMIEARLAKIEAMLESLVRR